MVHHHRLRDKLTPPRSQVQPVASVAEEAPARLASVMESASKMLTEHPRASLLTALAAGVVVGWIIKRR